MDLTIEVERRAGQHFEPYITDHDNGCVYHFHNDDISEDGTQCFAEVFTQQAIRWHPRSTDTARGPRIPITMELRDDMPDGVAIVVDDRAECIRYTVRKGLISQHGAESITRTQSERSPDWERLPACYTARLRAV